MSIYLNYHHYTKTIIDFIISIKLYYQESFQKASRNNKVNIPSGAVCLVYCFYVLRPFQAVLMTSSCGADRKEIRKLGGGSVLRISLENPAFLLLIFFKLKGDKGNL